MEGPLKTITALRHYFCTDSDTDVDAAGRNLVGDILGGFEAGGAEAVDGGCGGGVGEAGCKGSGSNKVGGSAFGDLEKYRQLCLSRMDATRGIQRPKTYIATADILNELGVQLRLRNDLLQQRVDQKIKLCVFKAAFEAFG